MAFGVAKGWGGEGGRDVVSDAYVGQWHACILFRRPRDLLICRCGAWVLRHLSFCLRIALADAFHGGGLPRARQYGWQWFGGRNGAGYSRVCREGVGW